MCARILNHTGQHCKAKSPGEQCASLNKRPFSCAFEDSDSLVCVCDLLRVHPSRKEEYEGDDADEQQSTVEELKELVLRGCQKDRVGEDEDGEDE